MVDCCHYNADIDKYATRSRILAIWSSNNVIWCILILNLKVVDVLIYCCCLLIIWWCTYGTSPCNDVNICTMNGVSVKNVIYNRMFTKVVIVEVKRLDWRC